MMLRGWMAALLLAGMLHGKAPTGQATAGNGEAARMHHAVGTFEVKMKPEALSEVANKTSIARMSIDKVFRGQLEGTSQGEFLASGSPDGSGGYVAMERVTGTLNGRQGSFVLQQAGMMLDRVPTMSVTVVPGSGTGELVGLKGSMKIEIEQGKHSYDFAYEM